MTRTNDPRADQMPLILVVTDTKPLSEEIAQSLRGIGYRTIVADRGETALSVAERYEPDAILLDDQIDGNNGLAICEQLKSRLRTADTPVIIVSAAFDSDALIERSFEMGATDMMPKPVREALLRARLNVALRETRLREEYKRLATQDYATGLDNRRQFFMHLCETVQACRRRSREAFLLICDIDALAGINVDYGYDLGDEVILMLARLTRRLISVDCRVGRIGGNAVAIIFKDAEEAHVNAVADRILRTFEAIAFDAQTQPKHFSLSIGIARFDGSDVDITPDHLMADADHALTLAKQGGGRQTCRYWQLSIEQRGEIARTRHARQRTRCKTERGFVQPDTESPKADARRDSR